MSSKLLIILSASLTTIVPLIILCISIVAAFSILRNPDIRLRLKVLTVFSSGLIALLYVFVIMAPICF